jgi:two-component sensor histidine kinase
MAADEIDPPPIGRRQGSAGATDPTFDPFDEPSIADTRQDMLSDELHHRVQNVLAVVLALARLTARSCTTIEEFQVAFGDRVQAMARTNALLIRGRTQAIDVRAALELELQPYVTPGGPVTLECEAISITPDGALSLSLLIHELATNAAKYGALSAPGGRLRVRCEHGPPGGVLIWEEASPGLVAHDRVAGAGSLLIERLARDLGGAASLDFRPDGLRAAVTFSLDPRQSGAV